MVFVGLLILNTASGTVGAGQHSELSFRLQDNLIRVPVQLNGHPLEAVLDSGTGSIAVDEALAKSLGMKFGASIGQVPGGGKPEPMFPLTLDEIDFGSERLEHVSAIALSLQHLSASSEFPVEVLLGRPVFADRSVLIDYPARKIFLFRAGAQPQCSNPVPLSFWGGVPVVSVTLKPTPASQPIQLHLIVDLGTRHFAAMIGGAFLDTTEGRGLEKYGHPMQVGTGTGGIVEGTSVSIAELTIGTNRFSNLQIALTHNVGAFGKNGVDGSLGVPLWESGRIILDYPQQKFCLEIPMQHR